LDSINQRSKTAQRFGSAAAAGNYSFFMSAEKKTCIKPNIVKGRTGKIVLKCVGIGFEVMLLLFTVATCSVISASRLISL